MVSLYVKSLQNIDPDLKQYYVRHESGCFALEIEGQELPISAEEYFAFKAEIREARNSNIALLKEIEALEKEYAERKEIVESILKNKDKLLDAGLAEPEDFEKWERLFEIPAEEQAERAPAKEHEAKGDPVALARFN